MGVNPRPKLLYLVHRVPYPPDKGDRIRAFHLLKYLSQHADVHLACLADEPVPTETLDGLDRCCAQVAVIQLGRYSRWVWALSSLARGRTVTEGAFRSAPFRDILRHWAARTRFDAILASASSMVPYLRMQELQDIPAVVDLVDVDSQKWLDYAAASRGPRAWLYRTEGRRLRQLERTLPTWTRAVTLVSEAEANLYREFAINGPIHAISNGVDLDYFQPVPPATELSCVFVGALDYRPNVDGACWFCQEVWPLIHRQHPQARFYLVGRQPTLAVCRLAEIPGVELIGQVPDVRPYLARSAVAVVPLQIARGVQNKVLEALALAKATVASPQALAGLRAQPGTHLLAASTPPQWVEAVLRLFNDPALRQKLGAAGRRYVEERHCWERCLEPFGTLFQLNDSAGEPSDSVASSDESVAATALAIFK